MSELEIVREVARILGKGDEVVDVACAQHASTVEATWSIEFSQAFGHHHERLARGAGRKTRAERGAEQKLAYAKDWSGGPGRLNLRRYS